MVQNEVVEGFWRIRSHALTFGDLVVLTEEVRVFHELKEVLPKIAADLRKELVEQVSRLSGSKNDESGEFLRVLGLIRSQIDDSMELFQSGRDIRRIRMCVARVAIAADALAQYFERCVLRRPLDPKLPRSIFNYAKTALKGESLPETLEDIGKFLAAQT